MKKNQKKMIFYDKTINFAIKIKPYNEISKQ